jgi:hypothetical protein
MKPNRSLLQLLAFEDLKIEDLLTYRARADPTPLVERRATPRSKIIVRCRGLSTFESGMVTRDETQKT